MNFGKIKKYSVFLPVIFTASFIFVCILIYGVNTPYWDEWSMAELFQKLDTNQLGFDDLYHQHNEHRILFPNIIMITQGYLTNWNIKLMLITSYLFSLAGLLLITRALVSKIKNKYIVTWAVLLTSVLYFSPVQYENWLWGWQLEWFLAILSIIISTYLLDNLDRHRSIISTFCLAIITATIATFSLGSAVLIWPIGFMMLLIKKVKLQMLAIWTLIGIGEIFLYYYDYNHPANHPSITLLLDYPLEYIKYVLIYFGRPFSENMVTAQLLGAITLFSLIPTAYILWKNRHKMQEKYLFWMALVSFSLMSGMLTAASRLGLGINQALSSRYTTVSTLILIGIIGVFAVYLDKPKIKYDKVVTSLVILSIMLPLVFSGYRNGINGMQDTHGANLARKNCTKNINPTDECLLSTYPNVSKVSEWIKFLRSKNWAGY